MNYQNIPLISEIKAAMVPVVEAEENARAWNMEARSLMGDVKTLISTAKKLNKTGVDFIPAELIKSLREEILAEMNPAEPVEETVNNTEAVEEDSPVTSDK